MAELTLEESIRQILPTLPLPIQKFFEDRKLGATARLLMERYALHIDQGTILERELMFLLLGLKSPDEFAAELYAQLPVSRQTVLDIINDVNQEVFIPLRQEEMKSAQINKETLVPTMPPPVSIPVPGTASHFHLENKIPLRPSSPTVPSSKVMGNSQRPTMIGTSKPINSNTLLEDHEEPHIEFGKTAAPSSPAPIRTTPPAAPFPIPTKNEMSRSMSPANLPGAMPSGVIPAGGRPSFTVPPRVASPVMVPQGNMEPKAVPPTTSASATPALSPAPSKPYATDPYREPIE